MADVHFELIGAISRRRAKSHFAIEIAVYAHVDTFEFAEFMEISEELNLAIIDIITESGTEFAVPINRSYPA